MKYFSKVRRQLLKSGIFGKFCNSFYPKNGIFSLHVDDKINYSSLAGHVIMYYSDADWLDVM